MHQHHLPRERKRFISQLVQKVFVAWVRFAVGGGFEAGVGLNDQHQSGGLYGAGSRKGLSQPQAYHRAALQKLFGRSAATLGTVVVVVTSWKIQTHKNHTCRFPSDVLPVGRKRRILALAQK